MFVSTKENLRRCIEAEHNCAECLLHKEKGGCCEGISYLMNNALLHLDCYQREKAYLSKEIITTGKMSLTGVKVLREQAIKEAKHLQSLRDEIDMLRKRQPIQINIDEEFKKECEYEIKVAKSQAQKEFAKELLMEFNPLRRFSKVTLRYRIACLLKKKQALDNKTNIYTATPNSHKEETT